MRAPWNVSVGRYLAITQKVMTNQSQTVWTLEPCNISHVAAFGTSAFFFLLVVSYATLCAIEGVDKISGGAASSLGLLVGSEPGQMHRKMPRYILQDRAVKPCLT